MCFENNKYKNSHRDGVGQLRAYGANWKEKLDNSTIPILTNGIKWAIFNRSLFGEVKELGTVVSENSYKTFNITNESDFEKLLGHLNNGGC